MKIYNNFNAMFNAQSGMKKDMSVFNFEVIDWFSSEYIDFADVDNIPTWIWKNEQLNGPEELTPEILREARKGYLEIAEKYIPRVLRVAKEYLESMVRTQQGGGADEFKRQYDEFMSYIEASRIVNDLAHKLEENVK